MRPKIRLKIAVLLFLATTIGTNICSQKKSSSVLNIKQFWNVLDVELSAEEEKHSLHCEKYPTSFFSNIFIIYIIGMQLASWS